MPSDPGPLRTEDEEVTGWTLGDGELTWTRFRDHAILHKLSENDGLKWVSVEDDEGYN
jgi:hypothetical protein